MPSKFAGRFVAEDQAPAMAGNTDLSNRQGVRNADGSTSTVRSIGVNIDGKEYLLPTVVGDRVVSNDEAVAEFRRTGKHLGVFNSVEESNAAAQKLHESEEQRISRPSKFAGRFVPEEAPSTAPVIPHDDKPWYKLTPPQLAIRETTRYFTDERRPGDAPVSRGRAASVALQQAVGAGDGEVARDDLPQEAGFGGEGARFMPRVPPPSGPDARLRSEIDAERTDEARRASDQYPFMYRGIQLATLGAPDPSDAVRLATAPARSVIRAGAGAASRSSARQGERAGALAAEEEFNLAKRQFPKFKSETSKANTELTQEWKVETDQAKRTAQEQTISARQAAEAEARRPTQDKSLAIFGLEDSPGQRHIQDPLEATEQGRRLYAMETPGQPGVPLHETLLEMPFEQRARYALQGKDDSGGVIGGFRDALTHTDGVAVPAGPLKSSVRKALVRLPEELKTVEIQRLYGRIDEATNYGDVAPGALRELIEETERLADATGDEALRRAYYSVRKVLVDREKALIIRHYPEEAPQYLQALTDWQNWDDVAFGSRRLLERANRGSIPQAASRQGVSWPAAAPTERVLPEPIPRPMKATAQRPEFTPEQAAAAERAGRPPLPARMAARGIRGTALTPGLKELSDPIADAILRGTTPTSESLSRSAARRGNLADRLRRLADPEWMQPGRGPMRPPPGSGPVSSGEAGPGPVPPAPPPPPSATPGVEATMMPPGSLQRRLRQLEEFNDPELELRLQDQDAADAGRPTFGDAPPEPEPFNDPDLEMRLQESDRVDAERSWLDRPVQIQEPLPDPETGRLDPMFDDATEVPTRSRTSSASDEPEPREHMQTYDSDDDAFDLETATEVDIQERIRDLRRSVRQTRSGGSTMEMENEIEFLENELISIQEEAEFGPDPLAQQFNEDIERTRRERIPGGSGMRETSELDLRSRITRLRESGDTAEADRLDASLEETRYDAPRPMSQQLPPRREPAADHPFTDERRAFADEIRGGHSLQPGAQGLPTEDEIMDLGAAELRRRARDEVNAGRVDRHNFYQEWADQAEEVEAELFAEALENVSPGIDILERRIRDLRNQALTSANPSQRREFREMADDLEERYIPHPPQEELARTAQEGRAAADANLEAMPMRELGDRSDDRLRASRPRPPAQPPSEDAVQDVVGRVMTDHGNVSEDAIETTSLGSRIPRGNERIRQLQGAMEAARREGKTAIAERLQQMIDRESSGGRPPRTTPPPAEAPSSTPAPTGPTPPWALVLGRDVDEAAIGRIRESRWASALQSAHEQGGAARVKVVLRTLKNQEPEFAALLSGDAPAPDPTVVRSDERVKTGIRRMDSRQVLGGGGGVSPDMQARLAMEERVSMARIRGELEHRLKREDQEKRTAANATPRRYKTTITKRDANGDILEVLKEEVA